MTVSADFTVIETGLFSKLSTAAGTVLWGAGTAARVYSQQAPAGVLAGTVDYVVFFNVGGGDENSNPAGSFDVDYQVECWSPLLSNARAGHTYIKAALHYQALTFVGSTNFWTVQKDLISTVENVEGKQWWRRGAVFQIRAG